MIIIEGKLHDVLKNKFFLELSNKKKVEVSKQTYLEYNISDQYTKPGVIKGYIIVYKGKPLSNYTIGYSNYPIDLVMGNPPRVFKTKKEATELVKMLNSRTKRYKYIVEHYWKEF